MTDEKVITERKQTQIKEKLGKFSQKTLITKKKAVDKSGSIGEIVAGNTPSLKNKSMSLKTPLPVDRKMSILKPLPGAVVKQGSTKTKLDRDRDRKSSNIDIDESESVQFYHPVQLKDRENMIEFDSDESVLLSPRAEQLRRNWEEEKQFEFLVD
mmetsp:Transcript_4393/g.6368  ORF Transcript_4393/g.6368 Transcript_4393/m.6368 type:complete len:155 (+) Transcript_4393:557-1021(+)